MSIFPSKVPGGVIKSGDGESHFQAGTTLTFKSHSTETSGGALIWEQTTPPGGGVPPHIHNTEDEFIYLIEGELEVTIGGVLYSVKPGDFVKMPRGIPHGIRMTGTGMTKSLWTVVPAGKMEEFFLALAALPSDRPPDPAVMARIFVEHNITLLPPPGA